MEVEVLQATAMEGRKRVLGKEHYDSLCSMGELTSTYCHQGGLEDARQLMEVVVTERKQLLGKSYMSTHWAMNSLADIYRKEKCIPDVDALERELNKVDANGELEA